MYIYEAYATVMINWIERLISVCHSNISVDHNTQYTMLLISAIAMCDNQYVNKNFVLNNNKHYLKTSYYDAFNKWFEKVNSMPHMHNN